MKTLIGFVEEVVARFVGPASGFTPKAPVYDVIRAHRPFDRMMLLFGAARVRPVWILRVTERDQDPVRYRYPSRWKAEARAIEKTRGRVGPRGGV